MVLAVLALAPAGAGAQALGEVWIDRFDGLAHRNDYGEAVAADAAGDVVSATASAFTIHP